MKNSTPTAIPRAENKFWIMGMIVLLVFFSLLPKLPLLVHISNLRIGCQAAHNTDVIWLSQYDGRVVCMIISNPLCCGSGSWLATDPSWPSWNWFYIWIQNKRAGEGGEQRRWDRTGGAFWVCWKTVFSHGKDWWLQWLTLIEHL